MKTLFATLALALTLTGCTHKETWQEVMADVDRQQAAVQAERESHRLLCDEYKSDMKAAGLGGKEINRRLLADPICKNYMEAK